MTDEFRVKYIFRSLSISTTSHVALPAAFLPG
jgi:hypothetical protein